jgi:hypothetical protein
MRLRGLILAVLLAGCAGPDLPPLPGEPGNRAPEPVTEDPSTEGKIVTAPSDPGALAPSVAGDAILPGVVLLDPSTDVSAGVATFAVRNDTGRDLPDLILAVIFAVPPVTGKGPASPRFETLEAPLRAGETRTFQATLASLLPGEVPASFRVVAGVPELLTAGETPDGTRRSGTTFLGGALECVTLEADLTAEHRMVTVGLASRGAALPPLEAQLLISRAGELQWTGPWILVPKPAGEGTGARRIQWNLDAAPHLAGCDLYLRVREKR